MAFPASWHSLQLVWMMLAMYSIQLNIYTFLRILPIDSIMVILTWYARLASVKHKDILMAVHIEHKLGILLISNPFEFFVVVDSVKICIQAFAFEVFGAWTPIFGIPVILWITPPIISIFPSSQRYSSWYLLTINFVSSSFHHSKSETFGAPRRCLFLAFARNFVLGFRQPFSKPQSRKKIHFFLQSISSSCDCRILCIQICNGFVVIMSNLSLGLDPSSIPVTCPLILGISKCSVDDFRG
jgi:hypothetical protein